MGQVLGIDFGTSNSAVGVAVDGKPHLIEMEPGQQTLPTAVFFDFEDQRVIYGSAAQRALIDGEEGRYMRALKSLLGTALMRESRLLLGKRTDFIGIVGTFLAELKRRAEAATGQRFTRALSGRPVLFHSADATRNAQALTDLTDCYAAAGGEEVRFLPEPEAAALAARSALSPGDLGLVVDIGGGSTELVWLDLSQVPRIDRPRAIMRLREGLERGEGTPADARVVDWISVPLGVATLREQFNDVEDAAARFALMSWFFEENLADFSPYHNSEPTERFQIVGTSGTVTTVAASHLGLKRYDRTKVDGLRMTSDQIDHVIRSYLTMGPGGRRADPRIGADRHARIMSGAAILQALMRCWPTNRLSVADRGLREGLLYAQMSADGVLDTADL